VYGGESYAGRCGSENHRDLREGKGGRGGRNVSSASLSAGNKQEGGGRSTYCLVARVQCTEHAEDHQRDVDTLLSTSTGAGFVVEHGRDCGKKKESVSTTSEEEEASRR
jgi:hypothetical protein